MGKTCTKCKTNPCTSKPKCTCAVKDQSTDCSVYTGETLSCSGITSNTILTEVIQRLDTFICNKFSEAIGYLTLINVGGGAEIFKGISGVGNKELRTLTSGETNLLEVNEEEFTIEINPGIPSMELTEDTDILKFIVTNSEGATTYAEIDFSRFTSGENTYVTGASFSSEEASITITRSGDEEDIVVPLGYLNNHIESGSYSSGNLSIILTDNSEVSISLTGLINEVLTAAAGNQVKSDYLETTTTSKAYIENKNPSKTVTLGVAGTYTVVETDNNYIIEIDNGTNDVTIDVSSLVSTNNFFVGFVQKGTGEVTFSGYTIKPESLSDVLYGQGHICSVEVINSTKYLHGTLKAE